MAEDEKFKMEHKQRDIEDELRHEKGKLEHQVQELLNQLQSTNTNNAINLEGNENLNQLRRERDELLSKVDQLEDDLQNQRYENDGEGSQDGTRKVQDDFMYGLY